MTAAEKQKRSRASGADSIVSGLMNLRTMGETVAKLVEADPEAAEILRDKLTSALNRLDADPTRPLPFGTAGG